MTKEEIMQQLLRAMPATSTSRDLIGPLGLSEIYRTAATDAIRPDSGEKDVPIGAGRSPLADEVAILTRAISDLRRAAQNQEQAIEWNTQPTRAASTLGRTGDSSST